MFDYEIIAKPNRAYDQFIMSHPVGHLFQSYAWGELKRAYGWTPVRLIIYQNNKIKAGISILRHRLFSDKTFYYAPRGPVLDISNRKLLGYLLAKIHDQAVKDNSVFLKIDPALSRLAPRAHNLLLDNGFRSASLEDRETLQLATVYRIALPYQNKSHITLIKQIGKQNELSVERNTSSESLKLFYGLLREYSHLTTVQVRSFSYYQNLWHLFQSTGIYLFLVRQKNYLIGASLLATFGTKCYSLYTVYRQRHLGLYPESFLHLAIMEWATTAGYHSYEIMDTFLANKKTSTTTRLFSFPIEPYSYLGEYDLIYHNFSYKIWRTVLPLYYWSSKV